MSYDNQENLNVRLSQPEEDLEDLFVYAYDQPGSEPGTLTLK